MLSNPAMHAYAGEAGSTEGPAIKRGRPVKPAVAIPNDFVRGCVRLEIGDASQKPRHRLKPTREFGRRNVLQHVTANHEIERAVEFCRGQ